MPHDVHVIEVSSTSPAAAELLELHALDHLNRYGFRDRFPADPKQYIRPAGVFVAAMAGTDAVGCGAARAVDRSVLELDDLSPADRVVEFKAVFVRADARRRGVATAVLRALERFAREARFDVIVLETAALQPEAIELYRCAGYAPRPSYVPGRDTTLNRSFQKRVFSA